MLKGNDWTTQAHTKEADAAETRRLLSFLQLYGMLFSVLPINGKRVVPLTRSGALLAPLIVTERGAYNGYIFRGILVVAVIALFIQANKKK